METSPFVQALRVIDAKQVRFFYQVELSPTEALDAAEALEPQSTGERLRTMVEHINNTMPLTSYRSVNGNPNPNDKQKHHTVIIGREYSRVIYVKIIKTMGYEHLTKAEWAHLCDDLIVIGQEFGCSENECESHTDTELVWRYWWD